MFTDLQATLSKLHNNLASYVTTCNCHLLTVSFALFLNNVHTSFADRPHQSLWNLFFSCFEQFSVTYSFCVLRCTLMSRAFEWPGPKRCFMRTSDYI